MAKKDLRAAAAKGADLFFSVNDEAKDAQEVNQVVQPHRAQDETQEQLAQTVKEMQEAIEAKEARRTQGRKGLALDRFNISLTPSSADYVRTMAGLKGVSFTRFIQMVVDRDAEANQELYHKAKELLKDAR